MTEYEIELTRLVFLGDKFIPPPPILTDTTRANRIPAIEEIIEKLYLYQKITGREVPTRILLYETELGLIERRKY